MENAQEKIKKRLKEISVTTDNPDDVSKIKNQLGKDDTLRVTKKASSSGMLSVTEEIPTGTETTTDTNTDQSAPTTSKGVGFNKKDQGTSNPEVKKMVDDFIVAIDRSPAAIRAKKLVTPALKLTAAIELVKKLRIPKAYLGKLKTMVSTAMVETEYRHGKFITEVEVLVSESRGLISEAGEDDGVLTVGELKKAYEIIKNSETKDRAIKTLKNGGKDIMEIGLSFLTAGWYDNIKRGVEVLDMVSQIYDPKSPKEKSPSPFIALFQIDPEVSKLLDDKIEYDFIKYAREGLDRLPDNHPIPDYFAELKRYIKDKGIATSHTVSNTNTAESVNPKMKKKDLLELIQDKNKLKVVETIKVKNLKK